MKGIVQKIIIAVVGLFFMFSACEVSTGYFHNTFDDDYDYYIQPNNTHSTSIAITIFHPTSVAVTPVTEVFQKVEILPTTLSTPLYFQYLSPPLFLKNCVWLI